MITLYSVHCCVEGASRPPANGRRGGGAARYRGAPHEQTALTASHPDFQLQVLPSHSGHPRIAHRGGRCGFLDWRVHLHRYRGRIRRRVRGRPPARRHAADRAPTMCRSVHLGIREKCDETKSKRFTPSPNHRPRRLRSWRRLFPEWPTMRLGNDGISVPWWRFCWCAV